MVSSFVSLMLRHQKLTWTPRSDFYNETFLKKITRRSLEEPLVPIGCALTVAAFINAYRAMRRGDHHQVQRMFRARVAAQGFTVLAIIGGGIYYADERAKHRELWKVKRMQEEEEKRQRWIKELEARDAEEKALRELMEKRRKRAADKEVHETGIETVAIQARAALKSAKEGKAVKTEDTAAQQAMEHQDQPAESKSTSSWSWGSLGGWFGGSKSASAKNSGSDKEA